MDFTQNSTQTSIVQRKTLPWLYLHIYRLLFRYLHFISLTTKNKRKFSEYINEKIKETAKGISAIDKLNATLTSSSLLMHYIINCY